MAASQPTASALRWGIVGPGRIAHRFAQALQNLPDARLVAVHGRSVERAQAFAQQWQSARKDGQAVSVAPSLQALVSNAEVDAVYVATPHSHHAEPVAAALLAGKAVLCEKSLVASAALAEPLFALAKSQGVFLMEALWTRFLPVYLEVGRWLCEGRIGPLRAVHSSFCFNAPMDPQNRLFNPALAGGALLDIGVYNLSLLRWVLQQSGGVAAGAPLEPQSWHIHGRLAGTGVDISVAGLLGFAGGVSASFHCAFDCTSANAMRIEGESGHILLPRNFWQGGRAELHAPGQAPQEIGAPAGHDGFEGQIEESTRCVRAGLLQSPLMPHAETAATLRWMDRMRAELGVRYPFE